MLVKLKYSAFAGKGLLFDPGIVEWPDDVPLPSTAEKVTKAQAAAEAPEPEVQQELPLKDVDPVTGNRKK